MSPVVNAPCRLGTTRILELLSKFNRNEATASDLPRLEKMLTCHAIISLWFGPIRRKSNEECIGFVSRRI